MNCQRHSFLAKNSSVSLATTPCRSQLISSLVRPLPSRGSGLDCYQRKEEDEMPMKAAVFGSLGKPPRFEEFPDPKPSQGEVIVHVKAAVAEKHRQDDGQRFALR